jgi:hypothetical protein
LGLPADLPLLKAEETGEVLQSGLILRREVGLMRFVSKPASRAAANGLPSITSSAMASNDGGTARPSALAVLRLITSSNLGRCRTGRSAGWMVAERARFGVGK